MAALYGTLPYLLFLFLSTGLSVSRLPWIDESWYAGPAVSVVRGGAPIDYGSLMWREVASTNVTLVPFGFVQAAWYCVGGINLIWGRLLSTACGVAALYCLDAILKGVALPALPRRLLLTAAALNYYFLFATSQIRPEAMAIMCTAIGLLSCLKWLKSPGNYYLLSTAHAAGILAALLHLQAAFVVLAPWIVTLRCRERHRPRLIAAVVLPYLAVGVVLGVWVGAHPEPLVGRLANLFSGDMLGHRGGMIGAAMNYFGSAQTLKGVVAVGLLVGIAPSVYFSGGGSDPDWNVAVRSYSALCFASWVLTTAHIDDYHAAWLFIPLVLGGAGLVSRAMNSPGALWKRGVLVFLVPLVALSAGGAGFSLSVFRGTVPVNSDYRGDMSVIPRVSKAGVTTVSGPRDILWGLDFEEPRFAIRHHKGKPGYQVEGAAHSHDVRLDIDHKLILSGRALRVYERVK